LARHPQVAQALQSIEDRREAQIQDWITLAQIPAGSGTEQERAKYVRAQLQKIGFRDVKSDRIGNVYAVREGTDQNAPTIAFAAHMDTVFGLDVPRNVTRAGGKLSAPGIGDDSCGLAGLIEAFRALETAGVKTKGRLVFVATVQEETRLRGAREFLEKSGIKVNMFVAVDIWLGKVWYGALRISRLKLVYTSPGSHTLFSRGNPTPVKAVAAAIQDVYRISLPPIQPGLEDMKLPVINVGMMGGGPIFNAIPQEAFFTVDLRSLDNSTQDRLESEIVRVSKAAADREGVGFRAEKPQGEDVNFSKARSPEERLRNPLVTTAVDVHNFLKLGPGGKTEPIDIGSTDANVAVGMGIPAIAVGAARYTGPHTLAESAEEASIVDGSRMLVLLAAALAGVE
jgi:acetylornithine deacetylase/succinyl-diaminopimelate desuccinylase-like protein